MLRVGLMLMLSGLCVVRTLSHVFSLNLSCDMWALVTVLVSRFFILNDTGPVCCIMM